MSAIEWNKVTWYSKLLALALFVALPFLFFWWGAQYGATTEFVRVSQMAYRNTTSTESGDGSGAEYYSDPSEWQTDANNTAGGFSISYPIDFDAQDNYSVAPSTDWRLNANAPGIKYFTLTVPRAFEPQTNFVDATLAVGASGNDKAIAACLTPDESGGPGASTATATINGIPFSIFTFSGAGAGNYYETTSYRTLHAGKCYAVEYTVHSAQIMNYPASYNLKPFDEQRIDALIKAIVGTFKFD